jgi:hypothetical protein
MSRWKQLAGFRHKRETGAALWQESYYDHVLRDDEELWRAARYILENPIRKGLVERPLNYPYAGSDTFKAAELRDLWARQGRSPVPPITGGPAPHCCHWHRLRWWHSASALSSRAPTCIAEI